MLFTAFSSRSSSLFARPFALWNTKIFNQNMKNTSNFIDLSPYPSLYRPELVKLHGIFDKYGYELRAAGGAVRDILLNKEPHDIDLATVATPDQMLSMFSNESIRVINRNGEAHGTVTPRVDDSMNYEITTLRVDVKTDGRHAHVQFTHDWVTDAARRDLTINSLFLRLHYGKSANLETHPFGELFDYFGGRDDLSARRIRFVGEPADRIQEDYLRILRYFRFHALIKPPERADEHDDEILQAILENSHGLSRISGERIWSEVQKIIISPSFPLLFRRLVQTGVAPHFGLLLPHPQSLNHVDLEQAHTCRGSDPKRNNEIESLSAVYYDLFAEVDRVWAANVTRICTSPATCLAALIHNEDELTSVIDRLHLSNFDITIIRYILLHRNSLRDLLSPSSKPSTSVDSLTPPDSLPRPQGSALTHRSVSPKPSQTMNDKLVPVYSSSFKKSSPFSESPLRGCDSFQPSALSFTTIGDTNLHNSNDSFKKTYVSPELSVAPRPANDTFSTSHSRPQLQLRPLTDNFTTVKSHFTSGLDPAFTQPNIPSSLSSPTSKSDVEASCRSLLLTFLMRQVAISPGETSRQKAVVAEALAYLGQAELLRTDWDSWQPPRFPVTGLNLTQTWNIKPGRQMGRVLAALRLRWADSDFQLTRDELLSEKFRLSLIEEDILVEANETCTKAKRKK